MAGPPRPFGRDRFRKERLTLQIWPEVPAERAVLRWWPGWMAPAPSATPADGRRQFEGVETVVSRFKEMRKLPMYGPPGTEKPFPGEPGGDLLHVLGDVAEGTWWADGYSVRRTLREMTDDEVRALVARYTILPWPLYRTRDETALREVGTYVKPPVAPDDPRLVAADPRWQEMLDRVGYPTTVLSGE